MHTSTRRVAMVLVGLIALQGAVFAAGAGDDTRRIGLSIHFMRDDYAVNLLESAEEVIASNPGYELVALDANANPQQQLADVENLLGQGIDALIMIPFDERAILPGLQDVSRAGIPTVAVTYIPNAEVVTTIGITGDYENGFSSGRLLADTLGDRGQVAIIDVGFSVWRIDERIRGFMDAITSTDIEVVARQSGVDAATVQDTVSNILLANPELDGVWATFSAQIIGAANALQDAGRDDVALTGIDADVAILELIRQGWVTGVAAQFPKEHGRLATQAAIDVLEGRAVSDGYEVPVQLVTVDNVDQMQALIWDIQ